MAFMADLNIYDLQVKKQERSFNSSQFNSKSFSITELVQEGSKYTFKPNMVITCYRKY